MLRQKGAMADYYPLIARAVGGLDKNTGENRRALYDRARLRLVSQLRGVEPAARGNRHHPRAAGARGGDPQGRGRSGQARARAGGYQEAGSRRSRRCATGSLRDFRETVAEAEGLGGAAAEANEPRTAILRARCRATPGRTAPIEPPVSS